MKTSDMITLLKEAMPQIQLQESVSMAKRTTIRVGGVADILVTPQNLKECVHILQTIHAYQMPYLVLGEGSNLLVRDGGIRGVTVHTAKHLNHIHIHGDKVYAESGVSLRKLCAYLQRQGLRGFAFASGIPGSVGGAVVMNAGAHGGEVGQYLVDSELWLLDNGELRRWDQREHDFGYRYSRLQVTPSVLLRSCFQFTQADPSDIQAEMAALAAKRKQSQPIEYPSAGSVFKRPEGLFAGKLVEDAGLKGYRIGGAQVSEKHAGFIINRGDATAKDVLDLIAHVQYVVQEQLGVRLELELKVVGEDALDKTPKP